MTNSSDSKISQLAQSLPPNATIGIIGGGQLGRMLAGAAATLGFRTNVLEPSENCPAAQVCNAQITAAYDDEAALSQLEDACDVITYEFENVPLSAAAFVENQTPLYPPSLALKVAQDRIVEKDFLTKSGVNVAPYKAIAHANDLSAALADFGKGVLKTRRFGYDGKGQHVFKPGAAVSADEQANILGALGGGGHGFVLEDLIDFSAEFSLIGARDINGTVSIYDPAENTHENGILRRSIVPAKGIPAEAIEDAKASVERILTALNYVGVIGVEFFMAADGILVNEIAPRVHNTGHWTVEACRTGQFEQHIRAITGLPLGSTEMLVSSCSMDNLLGNEALNIAPLLNNPNAHVTLYGKAEAREGRKMGHVTRLS